jgi:hypothetical protein
MPSSEIFSPGWVGCGKTALVVVDDSLGQGEGSPADSVVREFTGNGGADYLLEIVSGLGEGALELEAKDRIMGEDGGPGERTGLYELAGSGEAGTLVRRALGGIFYAARATGPDLSFSAARLSRYVTRWCPWATRELDHLMGYMQSTSGFCLNMKANDSWITLKVTVWSDADFNAPRSTGGFLVAYTGDNGTSLPIDWGSKRQSAVSTSSGESEAMAWAPAVKAAMRAAAMLERTRRGAAEKVEIEAYIDNTAVLQAVLKGASGRMQHMKKHAEVSFELLKASGVLPRHVAGTSNVADAFTKPLGRVKLSELFHTVFGHKL